MCSGSFLGVCLSQPLSHSAMRACARAHTHTHTHAQSTLQKSRKTLGMHTVLCAQGPIQFEHKFCFEKITHEKLSIFSASPSTMHVIFQRLGLHYSLQDAAFITDSIFTKINCLLHLISKSHDLNSILNENPDLLPNRVNSPCHY